MRVLVEVTGRTLVLGPRYEVGERLFLDDENPQHREVLAAGWVRRVEGPPGQGTTQPAATQARALAEPPADRMERGRQKKDAKGRFLPRG